LVVAVIVDAEVEVREREGRGVCEADNDVDDSTGADNTDAAKA
jgi:hypothetical protein